MKIRFVFPGSEVFYGPNFDLPRQSLTLMHLAALTPSEFEVELVDGRMVEIPFDTKANIVAITFTSATYHYAYEIADKYRKLGVTVILGGAHTSLFPEESVKHADAIVIGEAEHVWVKLLDDFKNGKLKSIYKSEKFCDLKKLPIPRYDLYNPEDFFYLFPVFISRGCPYNCGYCCIRNFYGKKYRTRPIDEVVEQIQYIKNTYQRNESNADIYIDFVDDNIWGNIKYTKELFKKLVPLKIKWHTQASVTVDRELLELAAESGCHMALIGFESLDMRNLKYLSKIQNHPEQFERQIGIMHEVGIAVGGFFIVGLPYDDRDCFINLEKFLIKNRVEVCLPLIYSPIPGTDQFNKMDWPGAQKSKDFKSVMKDIPVFTPPDMSKKQFRFEWVKMLRNIYSDTSIGARLGKTANPVCGNINYGTQALLKSHEWEVWIEAA